MPTLKDLLKAVADERRTLTRIEARTALLAILTSEPEEGGDLLIAALLTAMATRGETADELAGFAEAMRSLALPIPITAEERAVLVDTCGTGGDGRGTFNISTGAALVATAAGAKVAKHGNRGVTSRCGSADVLEALGVPVALSPWQSAACLRATGFTFLYAPALHPAMKRVQPIRRALGFRTIFNLAGPLTNPAGAPAQIVGVFAPEKLETVAGAMAQLGVRRGRVVHARDGVDEISLSETDAILVSSPNPLVRTLIHPENVGLMRADLSHLRGGDTPEQNAAILESIFVGDDRGPRRDVVLVNAAAALEAAGLVATLKDGVTRAAAAIDSGAARQTLAALRDFGASLSCEPGSATSPGQAALPSTGER